MQQTKPRPRLSSDTDSVARIVAAARKCFSRNGVSKTWMATVAAEAGMARQTLYTFVGGRGELIELALAERCRELAAVFAKHLGPGPWQVRRDLVELMAVMVETCQADREFTALAGAMRREQAFYVLAGPSRLRPFVLEVVQPLLEQARDEALLRPSVPDEEFAGWIQSILTPLAGRTDLSGPDLRQLLERFAVPALLVDR